MADDTKRSTHSYSNSLSSPYASPYSSPDLPTGIPARLGLVLRAIDHGVDPTTLPPELTHGFNLPLLRSLPKSLRGALVPRPAPALAQRHERDTELDTLGKQRH